MDPRAIREKFGGDYLADERTFVMGIDRRFTSHFAERLVDANVLETCTGAGFATISLARAAKHVVTVEINQSHQEKAIKNVQEAGLSSKVTFVKGSILDEELIRRLPPVDAAFIDPDWAATGPDHVYRFLRSNTRPPADVALRNVLDICKNVAIVLPPLVDTREFCSLPNHELERLYLNDSHELFCLYLGRLARCLGESEFRA